MVNQNSHVFIQRNIKKRKREECNDKIPSPPELNGYMHVHNEEQSCAYTEPENGEGLAVECNSAEQQQKKQKRQYKQQSHDQQQKDQPYQQKEKFKIFVVHHMVPIPQGFSLTQTQQQIIADYQKKLEQQELVVQPFHINVFQNQQQPSQEVPVYDNIHIFQQHQPQEQQQQASAINNHDSTLPQQQQHTPIHNNVENILPRLPQQVPVVNNLGNIPPQQQQALNHNSLDSILSQPEQHARVHKKANSVQPAPVHNNGNSTLPVGPNLPTLNNPHHQLPPNIYPSTLYSIQAQKQKSVHNNLHTIQIPHLQYKMPASSDSNDDEQSLNQLFRELINY